MCHDTDRYFFTAEILAARSGVSKRNLALFREEWPDGCTLCEAVCRRCDELRLPHDYFAIALLDGEALAAFEAANKAFCNVWEDATEPLRRGGREIGHRLRMAGMDPYDAYYNSPEVEAYWEEHGPAHDALTRRREDAEIDLLLRAVGLRPPALPSSSSQEPVEVTDGLRPLVLRRGGTR